MKEIPVPASVAARPVRVLVPARPAPAVTDGPAWHREDECPVRPLAHAVAELHRQAHGDHPVIACVRQPCAGLAGIVIPGEAFDGEMTQPLPVLPD